MDEQLALAVDKIARKITENIAAFPDAHVYAYEAWKEYLGETLKGVVESIPKSNPTYNVELTKGELILIRDLFVNNLITKNIKVDDKKYQGNGSTLLCAKVGKLLNNS